MNMETIYEWGLSVIRTIQQIQSPVLTAVIKGITFFGAPTFYILFLMIIYWCVDIRKGFRLGTVVIFSGALNVAVKQNLQVPRPYQNDPSVFIIEETGFSTPSGHAQASAAFWPVYAHLFRSSRKKTGMRIPTLLISVAIPLLISFTRIYLGVHYPTDVILGLIFGFLTSIAVILFWNDAVSVLFKMPKSIKLLITALICFALNMFSTQDTSMPGMLFGFIAGYIFLCEQGSCNVKVGNIMQKIIRFAVGVAITSGIYFLLKIIFDFAGMGTQSNNYYSLCRFVRYGATGFALSFISPAVFIKLKLASASERKDDEKNNPAENNSASDTRQDI